MCVQNFKKMTTFFSVRYPSGTIACKWSGSLDGLAAHVRKTLVPTDVGTFTLRADDGDADMVEVKTDAQLQALGGGDLWLWIKPAAPCTVNFRYLDGTTRLVTMPRSQRLWDVLYGNGALAPLDRHQASARYRCTSVIVNGSQFFLIPDNESQDAGATVGDLNRRVCFVEKSGLAGVNCVFLIGKDNPWS